MAEAVTDSLLVIINACNLTEWKVWNRWRKDLLVNVVEWFVADFTTNGKVDVVTVSKSSVSVEAVVDDSRSSATSTTSTYSSSAVVEVALGTFAILDGKERNVILHFLNSNAGVIMCCSHKSRSITLTIYKITINKWILCCRTNEFGEDRWKRKHITELISTWKRKQLPLV